MCFPQRLLEFGNLCQNRKLRWRRLRCSLGGAILESAGFAETGWKLFVSAGLCLMAFLSHLGWETA